MADKTLCMFCKWMDPKRPSKDGEYYYCKMLNKYTDPKKNTSCAKWNKD